MYIRDARNTKGHVSGLTAGCWHPTDRFTVLTASEDGTVRCGGEEGDVARCFGVFVCLCVCFCVSRGVLQIAPILLPLLPAPLLPPLSASTLYR